MWHSVRFDVVLYFFFASRDYELETEALIQQQWQKKPKYSSLKPLIVFEKTQIAVCGIIYRDSLIIP